MKKNVFKGQEMEVACWAIENLLPNDFKEEMMHGDLILLTSLIYRHGIKEVRVEDEEPIRYQNHIEAQYFDVYFIGKYIITVVKK